MTTEASRSRFAPTTTPHLADPTNSASRALATRFDVFIESSVEGLRKPDPAIYALACERLGRKPAEVVFLDDIGPNLKPARAMGMETIKVDDPREALEALGQFLGFDLVSGEGD